MARYISEVWEYQYLVKNLQSYHKHCYKNSEANKPQYGTSRNIFLFIMGEDSMTGRPLWAWFRHRIEERRTLPIIEADRAENDDLPNTDDCQGSLAIRDFLNSTESGTRLCTVVVNDVIR